MRFMVLTTLDGSMLPGSKASDNGARNHRNRAVARMLRELARRVAIGEFEQPDDRYAFESQFGNVTDGVDDTSAQKSTVVGVAGFTRDSYQLVPR